MAGRTSDANTSSVALYTLSEAADIVQVKRPTFHKWARGYVYRGLDGQLHPSDVLITTTGTGRGPVVPFEGLGEGYVLAAFRRAGVPMQRIRPALDRLNQEFGMLNALTSDRLMTDGAEVLFDYRDRDSLGEVVSSLVVVRNQQAVFREVVQQYLRTISYADGRIALIRLPQFGPDVVVNPVLNFGQPTLTKRGIRVSDVRRRVAAGEPAAQVADDYRLALTDVLSLTA
jgi:uncharacterized protein (DUF433 family)